MSDAFRFLPPARFEAPLREIAAGLAHEGARNQILRHLDRLCASFAAVPLAPAGASLLDIGSKLELLPVFSGMLGYERVSAGAYLPDGEPFVDEEEARHPVLHFNLERMRAPVAAGTFDMVTLWEVIEHMAVDPMFAMANINRALRPGGHLVISTVNCASLLSIRKILRGANPYVYPVYTLHASSNRHNREYSARELARLVRDAGFEVVRRQCAFFFSKEDRDLLERLNDIGFPIENPGDDTILLCRKVTEEIVRAPAWLYNMGDDHQTMTVENVLSGRRIHPRRKDGTPAIEARRG